MVACASTVENRKAAQHGLRRAVPLNLLPYRLPQVVLLEVVVVPSPRAVVVALQHLLRDEGPLLLLVRGEGLGRSLAAAAGSRPRTDRQRGVSPSSSSSSSSEGRGARR